MRALRWQKNRVNRATNSGVALGNIFVEDIANRGVKNLMAGGSKYLPEECPERVYEKRGVFQL
jgi:hypothetical protein